jgi:hypothetical protein
VALAVAGLAISTARHGVTRLEIMAIVATESATSRHVELCPEHNMSRIVALGGG